MLSLKSLLNPTPAPAPAPGLVSGPLASVPRFNYSPTSSPVTSYSDSDLPTTENSRFFDQPLTPPPLGRNLVERRLPLPAAFPKSKMSRSTAESANRMTAKGGESFAKPKLRGLVKFRPFETLDEESLREIERFRVVPFGMIKESCRHIPYNSGKKDFFEKTGRESFEVFKYHFKLPGEETEYTVMWDYNVGLVRMTPFFKCCRYGKTMPAKMLGLNPGLKDITHSITGGAITAQGYWMPYQCAKAVCATFCYSISGALIPIFGSSFPSTCVPPNSAEFGRMIIASHIIIEATQEAELFRRIHFGSQGVHHVAMPHSRDARSASPRRGQISREAPERDHTGLRRDHGALGLRLHEGSLYNTQGERDGTGSAGSPSSELEAGYMHSPGMEVPVRGRAPPYRTSGWTPANSKQLNGYGTREDGHYIGDPCLSAIPGNVARRFAPASPPHAHTLPHPGPKPEHAPQHPHPHPHPHQHQHHSQPQHQQAHSFTSHPPTLLFRLTSPGSLLNPHPHSPHWQGSAASGFKRAVDHDYYISPMSQTMDSPASSAVLDESHEERTLASTRQTNVTEKKAALLLLNFSMRDQERQERESRRREKQGKANKDDDENEKGKERSAEEKGQLEIERCALKAVKVLHRHKRRKENSSV